MVAVSVQSRDPVTSTRRVGAVTGLLPGRERGTTGYIKYTDVTYPTDSRLLVRAIMLICSLVVGFDPRRRRSRAYQGPRPGLRGRAAGRQARFISTHLKLLGRRGQGSVVEANRVWPRTATSWPGRCRRRQSAANR